MDGYYGYRGGIYDDYDYGYGGPAYETRIENYTEGTLFIDGGVRDVFVKFPVLDVTP
jgi:hypothetical protein